MKLDVPLEKNPYQIIIEEKVLNQAGSRVAEIWQAQKIVIITDNNVEKLYANRLKKSLEAAGFQVAVFSFEAGESSKNLSTAAQAYDFMADFDLTRSDGIISLGGGVVGDLAGFVASTYMRGIHFIQIPTTLLAQVDSSIGGKTGVNTLKAKNIVGSFAQPDLVLIDPSLLTSLDLEQVSDGMAEVIKCALIADEKLWIKLDAIKDLSDLLANHIAEIIEDACRIKRDYVLEDEFDNGSRLKLNFGHTIGHAIEAQSGYGKISHGQAVAIGMVKISQGAENQKLIEKGLTKKVIAMLEKFKLPSSYDLTDELYNIIKHDKKAQGSTLRIVLVEKIGQAKIKDINIKQIKEYL